MFYDNYVKLCNSINKAPTTVAIEMGFQRSAVTKWKGKVTPTDATLQKISDYFGVSVRELTGEEKKPAIGEDDELSEDEIILIKQYRAASAELKAAVHRIVKES